MSRATLSLSIYVRTMIAYNVASLCTTMMALTFKMLPSDCPSTIYAKSRVSESNKRLKKALGPKAAACYLAHRHQGR